MSRQVREEKGGREALLESRVLVVLEEIVATGQLITPELHVIGLASQEGVVIWFLGLNTIRGIILIQEAAMVLGGQTHPMEAMD